MKFLLSGFIGAIIGAVIASIVSFKLFKRQLITNQYLSFVDEIEKI